MTDWECTKVFFGIMAVISLVAMSTAGVITWLLIGGTIIGVKLSLDKEICAPLWIVIAIFSLFIAPAIALIGWGCILALVIAVMLYRSKQPQA